MTLGGGEGYIAMSHGGGRSQNSGKKKFHVLFEWPQFWDGAGMILCLVKNFHDRVKRDPRFGFPVALSCGIISVS